MWSFASHIDTPVVSQIIDYFLSLSSNHTLAMKTDRKKEEEEGKGDEKKNSLFTQYKNLLTRYPLIINGIQARSEERR